MNVSLRETGCLKKSLDGIFFSSCLRIMHIKVVFITAALLCLQRKPRKLCLIDVQALNYSLINKVNQSIKCVVSQRKRRSSLTEYYWELKFK